MVSAISGLALKLLFFILFFAIILSSHSSLTNAQVAKTYLGITAAAVNNTTVNLEQHNGFMPSIVVHTSSLANYSSLLPAMSTVNNSHHQSSQLPPIANAGHNQVTTSGSTVILNGSESRSPGGVILAYSWKAIPTSLINLGGVNSSVWEFAAPKVSTNTLLSFQLNVTDNLGQTGTAFVNVLDKPAMTIHALPKTQITKQLSPPSTITIVPSNNQSRGSNSVNMPTNKIPTNNVPILPTPPMVPPITTPDDLYS